MPCAAISSLEHWKGVIVVYALRMEDDADVKIGREIGDRLKWFAKQRGLSNGQLSYKTGLSTGQVSMLLNGGIQNPGIGTVIRFAQALELTLDQVLGTQDLPIVTGSLETPEFAEVYNDVQHLKDGQEDLKTRLLGIEEILRRALPQAALESRAAAEVAEQAPRKAQPTSGKSKRKSS